MNKAQVARALPCFAIPVASFAWFWIWRSNTFSGGDSEYWERLIFHGAWFNKRQMFSFITLQTANQVAFAIGGSTRLAFNFVSCLGGSAALYFAWLMLRDRPNPWWSWSLIATAGFTTIFYGHIETYALPAAALTLHLLAVQRSAEDRWPPWAVAITFSLFAAFHLVALFAFPAAVFAAIRESSRRGHGARGYRDLAIASVPGATFLIAIFFTKWGAGELVADYNIAPLRATLADIPVKLKHAWWNAGLAAILAPAVLVAFRRDRTTAYFSAYFACFLVFALIWAPHAREADFDLFSFPWIVAVVVVARWAMELPARSALVGAMLGLNLFLWISRPLVYSNFGRHAYGDIVIHPASPLGDTAFFMLDDRFRFRETLNKIPAGPHELSFHRHKRRTVRRAINLRPGETIVIESREGEIEPWAIRPGKPQQER